MDKKKKYFIFSDDYISPNEAFKKHKIPCKSLLILSSIIANMLIAGSNKPQDDLDKLYLITKQNIKKHMEKKKDG